MELREHLRKARISAGLTLQQVGVIVGRSHSIVSRWEQGTASMPDWATLQRWSEAVGLRLRIDDQPKADDPFELLRNVMSDEDARRLLLALESVKKVS